MKKCSVMRAPARRNCIAPASAAAFARRCCMAGGHGGALSYGVWVSWMVDWLGDCRDERAHCLVEIQIFRCGKGRCADQRRCAKFLKNTLWKHRSECC